MLYFKIFNVEDFDEELDVDVPNDNDDTPVSEITTGQTNYGYIYAFHGSIDVTVKEHYLYEKKHPVKLDTYFRSGKHFIDTLKITLAATPKEYEDLYYASIRNNAYLIAWETENGFQFRWVRTILPFPNKLRFLNGKADFTLETAPYTTVKRNLKTDFMRNFRYNRSTIENTVWN
jgi:hypothetical protein